MRPLWRSFRRWRTNRNDSSGGVRVPIIRINYDPESKIERVAWIIGQEKDNSGNIINEGKRVKGFVILEVKRRYNLYDQLNNDNNCCSPMFDYGEEVRGNKHGYVCGKTCPRRDKETFGAATCKAQYVPFGMAITTYEAILEEPLSRVQATCHFRNT